MTLGTKSLLFGIHCLPIHGFFVWAGWVKLYGWTWDPRVILACFIHDIGYWGCKDLDGPEGKNHPERGALVMTTLFDADSSPFAPWYCFTKFHSRSTAKSWGYEPSKLCWADKMAFVLEPWWLYLPRAYWSGELRYCMDQSFSDLMQSQTAHICGTAEHETLFGAATLNSRRWFAGLKRLTSAEVKAYTQEKF